MSHATHFLGRLERLSSPQADFALELYRNSALVRFILERARLPDGAERVALAVDPQPDGPHIIVARDGAFITCLGAGMSTNDLPVVTHGQIEHLGSRFEAFEEAKGRLRDQSEVDRLYRKLVREGETLSREDFQALAALMPIIGLGCLRAATDTVKYQMEFQQQFTRRVYRRVNDDTREALRNYRRSWLAVSHLLALCGTRGTELSARLPSEGEDITYLSSRLSIYSMSMPVMLRASWTAARVGRDMVTLAKPRLRDVGTVVDLMTHGVPLMAVALRHRSVRAEVQKTMARTRRGLEQSMRSPVEHGIADALLKQFERLFEPEPEGEPSWAELHREIGASYAVQLGQDLPEGHPQRYASVEEVPDDVSLALPIYVEQDLFHGTREFLTVLTTAMPWLISADAADFYLPAHFIDAYRAHWPQSSPEATLSVLESQHRYFLRDLPARAEPKPGRNAPCPCGSGKKYKRCCGA